MSFQKMQSMSRWKLNALALFFLLDTLARAVWRRKGEGIRGLIRYPWLLSKYLVELVVGFFLLTWRVRIILSAYAWFRRVDDVMDKDAEPPRGYTRESYLAQKQKVVASLPNISNCSVSLLTEDLLLVHLLRESSRCGVDVVKEIVNLWSVMCWDNERRSRSALATREEMTQYATLQDDSILGVYVKVFNGDTRRFYEVSQLLAGIFTKTDWLSDLDGDLQKGIVNIPRESFAEYDLELSRLLTCKSWEDLRTVPGFTSWYVEEVKTLDKQWTETRAVLGQNFGGTFSSRLLIFVFQKFMVEEFECSFEKLSSRIRV